ncbi:hypothetical protein KC644_03450 [Candidatus Berkelbacteria bacterium]|nr:hypothetical protein [Candidatus Berkelbacteria bacterium]
MNLDQVLQDTEDQELLAYLLRRDGFNNLWCQMIGHFKDGDQVQKLVEAYVEKNILVDEPQPVECDHQLFQMTLKKYYEFQNLTQDDEIDIQEYETVQFIRKHGWSSFLCLNLVFDDYSNLDRRRANASLRSFVVNTAINELPNSTESLKRKLMAIHHQEK